jgi:hypothetical protein
MSTNCCIILKVRDTDKGKLLSFNKSKLPLVLKNWKAFDKNNNLIWDRTGIDTTNPIMVNSDFIAIYCHWDGYKDGVGKTLKRCFKSYDEVMNLILGGDCSEIAFKGIIHYANKEYADWEDIKPGQANTKSGLYSQYGGQFVYYFDEKEWWYKKDHNPKNGFKKL